MARGIRVACPHGRLSGELILGQCVAQELIARLKTAGRIKSQLDPGYTGERRYGETKEKSEELIASLTGALVRTMLRCSTNREC